MKAQQKDLSIYDAQKTGASVHILIKTRAIKLYKKRHPVGFVEATDAVNAVLDRMYTIDQLAAHLASVARRNKQKKVNGE
jgi:hypothetical protein